jgi:hypothetical protein
MMSKLSIISLLTLLYSSVLFSQSNATPTDSLAGESEKKWSVTVDVFNRYLWRGQCWGGDYAVVQPTLEYAVTPKLTVGIWGTSNGKFDYFYPDGETSYKGYQELDLYIKYQLNDFMQVQVWDYYWPTVQKVQGIDNRFLNYGADGVKTVDAMICFDFSDGYKYPFNATISTLVAGNDYRYDSNGEHPKQNYTTYLELGYTLKFFDKSNSEVLQNIEVSPVIGAVLNNKAQYYTSGDYDKVSFVNMGVKVSKEIDLGNGVTMPISLNYIHNGAQKNTETFGRNFLVGGISFSY